MKTAHVHRLHQLILPHVCMHPYTCVYASSHMCEWITQTHLRLYTDVPDCTCTWAPQHFARRICPVKPVCKCVCMQICMRILLCLTMLTHIEYQSLCYIYIHMHVHTCVYQCLNVYMCRYVCIYLHLIMVTHIHMHMCI